MQADIVRALRAQAARNRAQAEGELFRFDLQHLLGTMRFELRWPRLERVVLVDDDGCSVPWSFWAREARS
jgi:hypothetical protein